MAKTIRAVIADGVKMPTRRLLVLEGLAKRRHGCWWRYVCSVDDYADVETLRATGIVDERRGVAAVLREDTQLEMLDDASGELRWSGHLTRCAEDPVFAAGEARKAAHATVAASRAAARRERAKLTTAERDAADHAELVAAVADEIGRRRALGLPMLSVRNWPGAERLCVLVDARSIGAREVAKVVAAQVRRDAKAQAEN